MPVVSVSAAIRNLELGGRLVKTTEVRRGQHAYVTSHIAPVLQRDRLMAPTPRRVTRHAKLVRALEVVLLEWRDGARHGGDAYTGDDLARAVRSCISDC